MEPKTQSGTNTINTHSNIKINTMNNQIDTSSGKDHFKPSVAAAITIANLFVLAVARIARDLFA